MSQISFVVMGNSINMFSFPNSHICFSSKIYVALIGLEVCFFAKRVRVLFKGTWRQTMVICFLCHPETIKSDGAQRQIMVIFPLFEDFNVFRLRLLQFHSPSRDNQVRWHAETNYGHPLPSLSRDNQVRWRAKINYGHLPPFQRLNVFWLRLLSLLCYPETIKSDGT